MLGMEAATSIRWWVFNLVIITSLTGCFGSDPDSWGTYQGNRSHDGYVNVTVQPANFNERWVKAFLGAPKESPITTDNDFIYMSRNKQLLAIDVFDANTQWAKDFSSRDSLNPPAVENGRVYVQTGGHGNSFLWAYTAESGELEFQSAYGNQWSRYLAPTIDDGTVYVAGGYYDGLYAFDAEDGDESWFFTNNDMDGFTPTVTDDYVFSYTDDNDPRLSVLDKETGEELFGIADPNYDWRGWSLNAALVSGGLDNVILRQSSRLLSFNLETKAIAWEVDDGFVGQPAVAKGIVYSINQNHIEARRESDGEVLWVWSAEQGGVSGNMVVVNNLLFVRKQDETHAIDLKTHESVWQYSAAGELAISDGTLYISSLSKLVSIDLLGDSDSDGLPDFWENEYGGSIDPVSDADNDGLTALQEFHENTNPTLSDTDDDGLSDGREVNEYDTDPLKKDSDGDGLTDAFEIHDSGTNPLEPDSDWDGITDDVEIESGLDPLHSGDAQADNDLDGYSNLVEVYAGSDLNDATSVPDLTWSMLQGNAKHNGFFPVELQESDFVVRWQYAEEGSLNPVVNVDGKVFLSSDSYFGNQYLKALDAFTGEVLWANSFASASSSGLHSVSGPSVSNGSVYVHTGGHEDTALRGFDLNTGDLTVMGGA